MKGILNNINTSILTTLKLQPIVLLYTFVSVCSKFASKQLPSYQKNTVSFILDCFASRQLLILIAVMFISLGLYAYFWQFIIKGKNIAVVYANKSTYLFWTQLAAIIFFNERITFCNVAGVFIVFCGVILNNSEKKQ